MEGEAIYIVLIEAHTGLASVARRVTRYRYTHVAVCLDASLQEFITFSRRRHHIPMDAGFMRENRACYAFGPHRDFGAKVFRVPVTPTEKRRIAAYIQSVEADGEYLFNLFSMATMPVVHGFRIYKAHNCMSFTAKVLSMAGGVQLQKPYYRYSIRDLDALLETLLVFEGRLAKEGSVPPRYMQKAKLKGKLQTGAGLCIGLSKRLFSSMPLEK